MARANKRDEVLNAISTIIERDGLIAVTLDAVAAETGMTRAGLLYHFPSRDALITATHQHLAKSWAEEMADVAGKREEDTTPLERQKAYIEACAKAARRAELLMMLENSEDKTVVAVWQNVMDRWAAPIPEDDDPLALDRFIARLAADGLWAHDALNGTKMPDSLRARVAARLTELAQVAEE